jgi:hypothetical protein
MKNKLIILLLLFCSCNQQGKELKISIKGDFCFFINGKDTIKLGLISHKKDLFQGLNTELFPNIQNNGMDPPQQIDVYNDIEGIYINSKIFDCFDLKNGSIKKIDNAFDILFIYPEMSRYNSQFSQTLGYRVFHYLGFLYQEYSPGQNLPYYVQHITKKDDNSFLITYMDKSNYMGEKDKKDTIIFSTFPTIKIEFSDKKLGSFQRSTEYIKLSDEIIKEVNFSIPANSIPQDISELYLKEIITQLVNIKFNTKLKTSDIICK